MAIEYKTYLPYGCNSNAYGKITLRFGVNHTGVDSVTFNGSKDWSVCAICDATVTQVYVSPTVGNVVSYEVDSNRGHLKFSYYHLGKVYVKVGQKVSYKTKVGYMGRTGSLCKGVHLHVSLWANGKLTNPEPYVNGSIKITENGGASDMVRKVTASDLNLRPNIGTAASNKPYGTIPVGTLLNPQVTSAGWGKVTCKASDGKVHTGWCNLGSNWSTPYTGEVFAAQVVASSVVSENTVAARKVKNNELNLRPAAGTGNKEYGKIAVGAILLPTEIKKVGTATWGKVTCQLASGATQTGWCNLGSDWSDVYTGVLYTSDGSSELTQAKSTISALSTETNKLKGVISSIRALL